MRQEADGGHCHRKRSNSSVASSVRRQHAHAAMLRPRFRHELRGDLEAISDSACRNRSSSSAFAYRISGACRGGLLSRSSQVVSSGTGRPVAPFSLPSFHATPAMSRCAQSNFLREPRQEAGGRDAAAGAAADVGEVGEVAGEAFLVVVPQRQLPARDRTLRRRPRASARASVSLLLKMPQATWPSATTMAPVSVAMSTTASGS